MSKTDRAVALLAVVQFFVTLEVSMLFPLGPSLAQALNFKLERLGLLNGAFLSAAFASGLLGALFLDRFNRRTALVWALAGLTVGTCLAGFAVDLRTLVACRLLAGIFGGTTAALSLAMVADIVAVEHRGRAMGVVARGSAVALVAGVPMAMQINEWGGWRWTFYAGGLLGVALAVLTAMALPTGIGARGQARRPVVELARELAGIVRRRATLMAMSCTAILMASMTMIAASIAPYMVFNLGFPQQDLKFLWIAGGAFTLVGSQLSGYFVDRLGAVAVIWIASAAMITVLMFMFVAPAHLPVAVLFSGFNIATSSRIVGINSVISMVPDPNERGRFMSMITAGNQLLSALAVLTAASLIRTAPSGALVNMNYVGMIAIAAALAVPLIAMKLKGSIVAH